MLSIIIAGNERFGLTHDVDGCFVIVSKKQKVQERLRPKGFRSCGGPNEWISKTRGRLCSCLGRLDPKTHEKPALPRPEAKNLLCELMYAEA